MLTKLLSLILLLNFGLLSAQLPNTNIYHFNITKSEGKYKIKKPAYLTAFNADGYNNHPAFFNDHEVYFTTNYYGDQTEIAKFDLFENVLTRITYTEESEYSPLPVPNKDQLSCVRVESDGKTQSLSIYPLEEVSFAKRYMNNTPNIGYYNWLDQNTLALFLVEEPHHELAIADALSERRKIILDKIGRTLKVNRDGILYFVHKLSPDEWIIKSYNNATNLSNPIVKTLPGAEDFEILNDGSIIMAEGSKIYIHQKNTDGWQDLIDLSDYNIKHITRLAVKKNRLIVVDNAE